MLSFPVRLYCFSLHISRWAAPRGKAKRKTLLFKSHDIGISSNTLTIYRSTIPRIELFQSDIVNKITGIWSNVPKAKTLRDLAVFCGIPVLRKKIMDICELRT
ncbi:unnamed protein product [Allacma fusca]|uniref:Uncharacterized protein n=1 Tax=Allacma fusca TaxID=39272 RepID=A0A8J2PXR8_9HEXA|nr:unnamed protein product [Allacma fusca]